MGNIFSKKLNFLQKYFSMSYRIQYITSMLPRNSQTTKRKCKEGDWICVRCANYNYAFRGICNRCKMQSKADNENAIAMMTQNNYGQNSFPSALFITLDPLKVKEYKAQEKSQRSGQEMVLRENTWISNLIGE